MLMIRLQRVGRRNYAEYRIVVVEHARAAQSGKYIDVVGHHNPHTDTTTIDGDKVKEWIRKGAQVSDTLHNLLITQNVIEGKKKNVLPKKKPFLKEDADDGAQENAKETENADKKEEQKEEVKKDDAVKETASEK